MYKQTMDINVNVIAIKLEQDNNNKDNINQVNSNKDNSNKKNKN